MENSLKVLFVGCGDIGMRAIHQLQHLGVASVAGIDWKPLAMRRHPEALPADIDTLTGDVRDVEGLAGILNEHCVDAMVVTLSPDEITDEGYRNTYVEAAQAIALAIGKAQRSPRLVLWVSSTGVYGQCNGEWVDEASETMPTSFRGKRLVEAENKIASLSVPSVVIRFSGIYGPGRSRLINKVKNGDIAPDVPLQWTNRIHTDDCAGVIAHLLTLFFTGKQLEQVYLATDNQPVSAHEVQSWLASELGVKHEENAPKKTGQQTTGLLGKTIGKRIGKKAAPGNRRCNNQRLVQSGYVFRYPTFQEGYRSLIEQD